MPCSVTPLGPIIIPIFLLSTEISFLTESTGPAFSAEDALSAEGTGGAAFALT